MSFIDQKEYLKRYLSGGDPKVKKRRKKKHPIVQRTMVIVDDDVDINILAPSEETVQRVEEELYDDAPTVAGVVDERPEVDQYRQSTKWKVLKDKKDEEQAHQIDNQQNLTSSMKKARHDSDSDVSPLRSKNCTGSNDDHSSPIRSRSRHDSDGDLSPLRSRTRHDSDSDLSPQRSKGRKNSDGDLSPVRSRKRHDSDAELLPVRSRTRHDSDSDLSPQRSKGRHDSDGDLSPVRSRTRHDSDNDLSPQRSKGKHDSDGDLLPVRTKKRHDSDSDLSPRRSKAIHDSDSDLSPERSLNKNRKSKHERKGQNQRRESDLSPARKDKSGKLKKTLSGHKAGLQDARTLKKENEADRRRQDRLFEAMGDEALGKHSATVFRDKAGKRRDLAKEKEEEKKAAAKEAKENEKFLEWGKGVAQKERQDQLVEDAAKEMTKPLARYENDDDLDSFLKEQERDGDPMLAMIRNKKAKERGLAGIKEKPRYKGPAPQPNRFKIAPGYRWDGVDRSNGFEKKYFARTANKKAMQEVKYKWSVEDM